MINQLINVISGGDVARVDQLEHEPCDLRVLLQGLSEVGAELQFRLFIGYIFAKYLGFPT